MKISIVGAGIIGLCTAWALARRGHAVQLFDQAEVPNPAGSSVDDHRLIRHPYGEFDAYVRMVDEAYAAWERVWADLGTVLYAPTGTIAFDAAEQGWAAASQRSMHRLGIAHEVLKPAEAAARFPHLRFGAAEAVLYAPSGGVLRAGAIVEALARHLSAARNVELHQNTRVEAVEADQGRIVLADGNRIDADTVVVAAGPWATRLVPALAARVTPSRQVVAYIEPPAAMKQLWAASPMVLKIGADSGFYAVPPVPGTGLKIGDHRFSLEGDPAAPRELRAGEAEALMATAHDNLVDFSGYRLVQGKVCFYDVEPEERFIVEPLGSKAWLLSGFSGHGFKFGPVIGEKLAAGIDGALDVDALKGWAAGR
ncbi:FAD-dependent oxidoreductase [Desertibaculum subflavum]|uniref:FAD-dependent oxidoreductase n=1 Tax=Desertibaculum subflavum TaxID=2268458 RepID=UPI000E660FC5